MDKLRLITTEYCGRNCAGCCNKDIDIQALPVISDFLFFKEIYITGGEPLLFPLELIRLVRKIKDTSSAKIYVYASRFTENSLLIVRALDGITFTLHEQSDIEDFIVLDNYLESENISMRLNVFKGIVLPKYRCNWKIKTDIAWIKNAPLPQGETLGRLEKLWTK